MSDFLVDVGEPGVGAQLPLPNLPELFQQGLEQLGTVEEQLVVEPQDGGSEGRFRDLRDGAKVFAVVAPVADPMNYSPPYLPAAETAAVPAEDMPDVGRVRWCGTPVEQLFPDRDLLLYPLELLPADNAGVVILHVVFGLLAPVFHLPDGKGVRGAGLVPF